ncbi:hypothetical protein [Streptomyces sp. CA2R106]|uniref:hypothetical protein n=1 Tax=Streptomyces sp. CA2R106 TaxID=3120153 RepID=UPI003009C798
MPKYQWYATLVQPASGGLSERVGDGYGTVTADNRDEAAKEVARVAKVEGRARVVDLSLTEKR